MPIAGAGGWGGAVHAAGYGKIVEVAITTHLDRTAAKETRSIRTRALGANDCGCVLILTEFLTAIHARFDTAVAK